MTRVDSIFQDLEMILFEHNRYLSLLEDYQKLKKVIEDVKAEIISLSDKADQECKVSNSYSVRDRLRAKAQAYDDVAKLIDQKIKECTHDT